MSSQFFSSSIHVVTCLGVWVWVCACGCVCVCVCFWSIPFLYFLKNLVLINRWNGPQNQRVLALCVFLTGAVPKGLIIKKKTCVWCLCMYVLFCVNLCQDWFCRFLRICGLMTCVKIDLETDCSLFFIIIYPLTARVVGSPQMISQPVSSVFLCSPLPSGTWQCPGLFIPWCCFPTSFSVCLVFFPLSLCLVRWFWPDLMNGRHVHTTAVLFVLFVCVLLFFVFFLSFYDG